MIVLMVIGASPASTGGGIKTTTFALLVLSARQVVQQKSECTIFGRRIDSGTIFRAFAIATMSMVWIFFEVIGLRTWKIRIFCMPSLKWRRLMRRWGSLQGSASI